MNKALEQLLKLEISKYAIAKYCGVSWNTVYRWSKDIFQPEKDHEDLMIILYANKSQNKIYKI